MTIHNPPHDEDNGSSQQQQEQQQQREQQQQQQSSSSWNANANWNGNGNGNWNDNDNSNHNSNCNSNVNVNANFTSVCVDVKVDLSASLAPPVDLGEGAIYVPQTIDQYIDGGHAGVNTEIALDQINSLISNGTANGDYVSNWGSSIYTSAHDSGDAQVGDVSQGALATGVLTAGASTAATADAFTQSIVLGANLQNNTFTMTITGHDSHVDVGGHH